MPIQKTMPSDMRRVMSKKEKIISKIICFNSINMMYHFSLAKLPSYFLFSYKP